MEKVTVIPNLSFNDCCEDAIRRMIHMGSMEQAQRAVETLAEGGLVVSPLKPHPKPDDGGCGSVTQDRFGYTWIITCPNPDKK